MPPLMAATLTNQVVTLKLQGMTRRAIARALGISRNTVRKLLEGHAQTRASEHSALPAASSPSPRSPGKADSYTEKVTGLLAKYPNITAQRIFEELREAGYDGGYTAIKDRVRKLRPRPAPKPSLVTPVTGPGEMAESDWSPYTLDLEGGGRITVQAFGYILRWSCRKYFGCRSFGRHKSSGIRDVFLAKEGTNKASMGC